MELLDLARDIVRDCYSYKSERIYSNIQCFIEIISENRTMCDKMLPVFEIIMSAIERKDIILLGDCFENGIIPIIQGITINYDLFIDDLLLLPNIEDPIFYLGTYSDEPALCIKNNNKTVYRLNSVFSPEHEVEMWFKYQNIKEKTPVVCLFGLGTGLFAEKILDKISKDSILIIFEPERDIYEYCMVSGKDKDSCIAEKKISKRIEKVLTDSRVYNIVGDVDGSALHELLIIKTDYIKMKGMVVCSHNNYNLVFPKSYEAFCKGINDYYNYLYTKNNVERYFKEFFLSNILHNIFFIKDGIYYKEIGKVLSKEVPVIIVSAGPSLNKNIDVLRQAKGHMLIVAVDSSLGILLKNGIDPDLTITIDPNKDEKCFIEEKSIEIPCLFSLDANQNIISRLKGKKIFCNLSDDYADGLFKAADKDIDMIYSNGGSVATTAFSIFSSFEQKTIILVGQDLAYLEGMSHVGGKNDQFKFNESLVDGVNGEKVLTRSDWVAFLQWFEKSIINLKKQKKSIRIIDATEGGALIHGTEVMTLQEAIDNYKDENKYIPSFNFGEVINQMEEFFTKKEYEMLLKKHKEACFELDEVKRLSEKAIEICDKLIDGAEKDELTNACTEKWRNNISGIENDISLMTGFPLINRYIECEIISEVSDLLLQDGDDKTVETNEIKAKKIRFVAIKEAAHIIKKMIMDIEITT